MGIKERKEREKEARRDEIIDAAEKVFFEKGLAQATMDEIAQAAELSKGTLYLYFKCKEDLYLAIHMRGEDILYDMFEKAVATQEPTVKHLMNIVDSYYDFFKNHRDHFRTGYMFENPEFHDLFTPEVFERCAKHGDRLWKFIVELIRKGIDEGMLHKNLDPMEAAVMMWSNNYGIMRLMDRQNDFWVQGLGLNLEALLRKSNVLLFGSMMTRKAKRLLPSLVLFDESERHEDKEPATAGADTH